MSSLRLSLRLASGPTAPRAARHALDGLELYIGDELFETIQLLVSELVSNSVRHARLTEDQMIEVAVSVGNESIRVEVADPGNGFQPLVRPLPDGAAGWGLFLTEQLSMRWGVSAADETRVWFEITPDHEFGQQLRGPRSSP